MIDMLECAPVPVEPRGPSNLTQGSILIRQGRCQAKVHLPNLAVDVDTHRFNYRNTETGSPTEGRKKRDERGLPPPKIDARGGSKAGFRGRQLERKNPTIHIFDGFMRPPPP